MHVQFSALSDLRLFYSVGKGKLSGLSDFYLFYSVGKGQEMHVQFSALSDFYLFISVSKGQELQVQSHSLVKASPPVQKAEGGSCMFRRPLAGTKAEHKVCWNLNVRFATTRAGHEVSWNHGGLLEPGSRITVE